MSLPITTLPLLQTSNIVGTTTIASTTMSPPIITLPPLQTSNTIDTTASATTNMQEGFNLSTTYAREGLTRKLMDTSLTDPGGTRFARVITLDTPLAFIGDQPITEGMLDAELERLEVLAMQQRVTDIKDQWGVDPMEFFVHHPTSSPTGATDGPLPISEEGSVSADNEEDWDAMHATSQSPVQFNMKDPSTMESDPIFQQEVQSEDREELPDNRTSKATNEIRRSARLLYKTDPITMADKTEHAAKIRSLESTPAPTSRTPSTTNATLGSVIISNNLFGREDIEIVTTAAGFRYSPGNLTIGKVIGDRVTKGEGDSGGPFTK